MNQLATLDEEDFFSKVGQTQKLCKSLMVTPHYAKLGEVGIFAILQKAKSVGMNPLEALNGGFYFVNGKVEMPGATMLSIIRRHGHSVQMDTKSTPTNVVMHGKRKDNGDTWSCSFSIEDAKRAGIYKNTWEKYPQIMLQWRCVSMLGRFLFSDILSDCYIEGEIPGERGTEENSAYIHAAIAHVVDDRKQIEFTMEKPESITEEQALELEKMVEECDPSTQAKIWEYLKKTIEVNSLSELPVYQYAKLKKMLVLRISEHQSKMQALQKLQEQEKVQDEPQS